uniref:Lipid desaturase domain-containing protein n=1 Tax=Strigamia maritima TaxID=126957 RepID=T1JP96_STRMM
MASQLLSPVKTEKQIFENSMPEDDPNSNSTVNSTEIMEDEIKLRWGPHHAGAKELANLYSRRKRTQEYICVIACIILMLINFYHMCLNFRFENWNIILIAAICGIISADFGSGLVHWGADTWGSIEVPIIGKIHKWSHTYFGLPTWVTYLQDCHIILPRWLNYPLEKIHFWSTLEQIIETLTGVKPRTDDFKWAQKRD